MTRRLISLATFCLLTSACGGAATVAPAAPEPAKPKKEATTKKVKATEEDVESVRARIEQRRVGDVFVHRYSGSYRDIPLLVTEEVVAREKKLLVIDYTFEEGPNRTKLRVRLDPKKGKIDTVSRMQGDEEVQADLDEYQELMDKTVFGPDYNEGRNAKKSATCLVAGKEQQCTTSRYHVFVGEKPATVACNR